MRSSLSAQVFCYISNLKGITWNFSLSWIHLRSVEVVFCHPGTAAALTEPVSIRKRWSSQWDTIICSIPSLGVLITPLPQGEMMLSFPWALRKRVLPTSPQYSYRNNTKNKRSMSIYKNKEHVRGLLIRKVFIAFCKKNPWIIQFCAIGN